VQFKVVITLSDSALKADPAKAAQHSQALIGAYRSLALFEYKKENPKGAVDHLLKAINYEPKNKPDEGLHLFLAQMYAVSLGNKELLATEAQQIKKKSCEEYKLVLKINPKNATAKKELGQLNCDK
ncbi:MAG: hypothetical protein PHP42_12375, partial [Bacteroidota bacterium]|nr:hypothetical protein [Bacteroidota bacterium]